MRLVFVGHACHLVELGGVRALTDPWLVDPIFAGHVEHDPPLGFGIRDLPPVDVLVLTHGHLDHFNAPTLDRWPDKSVPVVLPPIRFTELDANLRRLGFRELHVRDDWEPFEIGGMQIVPTPSRGVLDECAVFFGAPDGSFWNGADAPQPPEVAGEIAERLGPVRVGAFSHNSFDQPALLGLCSHKPADHGPEGAARCARLLGVEYAYAAASNLRWRGRRGEKVTRKVIRRRPAAQGAPLRLRAPGDLSLSPLRPGPAGQIPGPAEIVGTPYGGNFAQACVLQAAREIRAGRRSVVLVVGAENGRSQGQAARLGLALETTEAPGQPDRQIAPDKPIFHDVELAQGLNSASAVFALVESAIRHARGESPAENAARIAGLWADMAAGILVCSLGAARAAGGSDRRMVAVQAGTEADDIEFLSTRPVLHRSPALQRAGERLLELGGCDIDGIALFDCYSCFPSAVQVSATELRLPEGRVPSVTGGLTFGGGPLNSYGLHAVARMVELLRERPGERGLVHGNGGWLAKHSLGLYAGGRRSATSPTRTSAPNGPACPSGACIRASRAW